MTTDTILEQLSALADGELPPAEAELLLLRLSREPELRAAWERYHTVGEAMRNSLPARYPRHLARDVRGALDAEPAHSVSRWQSWRWPLASAALAAGVAVLGVLAMRSQLIEVAAPAPSTVVANGAATGTPAAVRVGDYDPALQLRLSSYVARHGELAGQGFPSMVPHVHVAAQDAQVVLASDEVPVEGDDETLPRQDPQQPNP